MKIKKDGSVRVSAKEHKKMAEGVIKDIDTFEIGEQTKKKIVKEMEKQGFVLNHHWDYDYDSDIHIGTFMNCKFEVIVVSFGVE